MVPIVHMHKKKKQESSEGPEYEAMPVLSKLHGKVSNDSLLISMQLRMSRNARVRTLFGQLYLLPAPSVM